MRVVAIITLIVGLAVGAGAVVAYSIYATVRDQDAADD